VATSENSPLPNASLDEAIVWFARMRALDVSTEDRSRFAEWLASDITHSAAFDEIMQLWKRLGVAARIYEVSWDESIVAAVQSLGSRRTTAALASLAIAILLASPKAPHG